MDPIALTARMSDETFSLVVQASPRQIREQLFSQLGVKVKSKSIGLRLHAKRDERVRSLHTRLKQSKDKREADVCRELIRNWLYTQRPLLKEALDFLGVSNDNGLIDTEPTFFAELSKEKVQELVKHMSVKYPLDQVEVYLRFMEVPHLDEAFS